MRALSVVLTALAGLAVLAGAAQAQGHKVAYLNSQRILAEAPGSQAVRDQIQQEMAGFESQIQALDDSLRAMIEDYNRKSVLLSPDEKRRQEEAITMRQQALDQQAAGIRQQAAARQQELMAPIMARIEEAIESIREEGGYALIFDAAQGALVSADTTLDVSSAVLEKIRSAASGPPARQR